MAIRAPDGANTINISIYQYKVCYQQEAEPRTRGKGIKSEPVRIKPQPNEDQELSCVTDLIISVI